MAKYRSGLTAYADGQVDPEQVLNPAIDRGWDSANAALVKTLAGDLDLTAAEVQGSGVIVFDGSPGAAVDVDFPPTDAAGGWHGERLIYVVNATADRQEITFRFDNDGDDAADGASVTLAPGLGAWLRLQDPDVARDASLDVTDLPEVGAPDEAADYGVVWDASAKALRRLLLSSWPGSGGGGGGGTSIVAGAWKTVETQTLSGVSEADFNLPSGFKAYKLIGHLRPATDSVSLYTRFSTDGGATFDATNNYGWAGTAYAPGGVAEDRGVESDSKIVIEEFNVGNAANEGASFEIWIERALDGTLSTHVFSTLSKLGPTNNIGATIAGGVYKPSSATDAIRLFFSSGNIAEGEVTLVALKPEEGIAIGEPRGALVDISAAQSIPNAAWTAVSFDQEQYDTDGFHESMSNPTRLTVPAGVTQVRLTAGVDWATDSSGNRLMRITKNGADLLGGGEQSGPAHGANTQSIQSAVLEVVAGDYFELEVFQNSGSALNLTTPQADSAGTYFAIEVVERTSAEDTKVLASADPAGVSEVDFLLDNDNYETFELLGWLEPASGSPELWLRVSDDGGATFKAGASGYRYAWRWQDDAPNGGTIESSGAAQVVLMTFVDEAVTFKVRIARAGLAKTTSFHLNGEKPNTASFLSNDGGGSYTGTEVIDAVRLLFDGANIAAGHVALIGIKVV